MVLAEHQLGRHFAIRHAPTNAVMPAAQPRAVSARPSTGRTPTQPVATATKGPAGLERTAEPATGRRWWRCCADVYLLFMGRAKNERLPFDNQRWDQTPTVKKLHRVR